MVPPSRVPDSRSAAPRPRPGSDIPDEAEPEEADGSSATESAERTQRLHAEFESRAAPGGSSAPRAVAVVEDLAGMDVAYYGHEGAFLLKAPALS